MERRRLLASIAAAGGTVLAGCQDLPGGENTDRTPPPTGTTPPTGSDPGTGTASPTEAGPFDTTLDMVADRGVDDTGERPIDGALHRAVGDRTLLEFPPGEYLVTEPLVLQDADRLGIRGTGDRREQVRFVHPDGFNDLFLNVRGGTGSLLSNFVVDQTDDRETATGIIFLQEDDLEVHDVEVAGFTPTEGDNPDDNGEVDFIPSVTTPGGTGVVERFVTTGGGEVGVYPDSYPGVYSGYHHQGRLRFVDCRIENAGGAGLYASRTRGTVSVEGGRFANNSVAQVRVSGEGSAIRGAEIVVDTDQVADSRGSYQTVRGVWWESGDLGKTGGVVENCRFVARSSPLRRGLLEVDGSAGAMAVRNCEFTVDRDGYHAINAFPPGSSSMGGPPAEPWGVTLENVRVTGSAAGNAAVRVAGRPGSLLAGVEVTQSGTDRDGISVLDSPGTVVRSSSVDVSRFPLRLPLDSGATDCWLEVAGDVDVRSRVPSGALDSDSVSVPVSAGSACLPTVDGDGSLVLVGRCDDGYVGGVVQEDFSPEQTGRPPGDGCS